MEMADRLQFLARVGHTCNVAPPTLSPSPPAATSHPPRAGPQHYGRVTNVKRNGWLTSVNINYRDRGGKSVNILSQLGQRRAQELSIKPDDLVLFQKDEEFNIHDILRVLSPGEERYLRGEGFQLPDDPPDLHPGGYYG